MENCFFPQLHVQMTNFKHGNHFSRSRRAIKGSNKTLFFLTNFQKTFSTLIKHDRRERKEETRKLDRKQRKNDELTSLSLVKHDDHINAL